MPFNDILSPSIGLGLLKAELAAQGMAATVRYFSMRFAELVGLSFYTGVCTGSRPAAQDLAGEWVFSASLFGPGSREAEYVDQILRKQALGPDEEPELPASPSLISRILEARRRADPFLRSCLEDILRARPKMVGFASMFQQHLASLALARLIKDANPEIFVVFGGANCEGVMGAETVRQFPFVDAAVSGEADLVFPALARRLLDGGPVSGLPGVRTPDSLDREFAARRFTTAAAVPNLDALPHPDYSDYFDQFGASRFARAWQPSIYMETSRGCWWGQRQHCTFCGLNDETMAFRSKSGRRALDEFEALIAQYPDCDVNFTDNILDLRYFDDFLPELAARQRGLTLFYEVKANLRKQQLRVLRDAGVRNVQPGIENFSDPVLRLMRKGVSALQNVQLLKWCKELGLNTSWNLLWGFPGEPPEEYERMAKVVPLLTHLPPPDSDARIRLDRFSPNFERAEELGFADVRPLPAYEYVYPLAPSNVSNLAYSFNFRYQEPRDVNGYVRHLERQVRSWRRGEGKQDLFAVDTGRSLLLWDLRRASRSLLTVLDGVDRTLYNTCDVACDVPRLAESLRQSREEPISVEMIEHRLERLVNRRLVLRDGARYLALAIPLGEYSPPARVVERFYDLLSLIGTSLEDGWLLPPDLDSVAVRRLASRTARASGRHHRADSGAGRLTTSQFSIRADGAVFVRRLSTQ